MFPAVTYSTSVSQEGSYSSVTRVYDFASLINPMSQSSISTQQLQQIKKKRNPHGNPDPDVEVVALFHEALMSKNRFICEVCNRGFYRDQILQLRRREHNLPWNLKQRDDKQFAKKVYVSAVPTCVHHESSRALSDITVLKKHYTRKHAEKMWKCETYPKIYALKSDWKAHSKPCGAKQYKCECGIVFSRENDLISHKALCMHYQKKVADSQRQPQTLMIAPPSNLMTKLYCRSGSHHHKTLAVITQWRHLLKTSLSIETFYVLKVMQIMK